MDFVATENRKKVLTMAEYIERDALMLRIKEIHCAGCDSYNGLRCRACLVDDALDYIDSEPAADVAPVLHGRWERIGIKGRKGLPIYPCCSACGRVSAAYRSEWEGLRGPWKYCPNCGARMDGSE